jgi:hypothetical protein
MIYFTNLTYFIPYKFLLLLNHYITFGCRTTTLFPYSKYRQQCCYNATSNTCPTSRFPSANSGNCRYVFLWQRLPRLFGKILTFYEVLVIRVPFLGDKRFPWLFRKILTFKLVLIIRVPAKCLDSTTAINQFSRLFSPVQVPIYLRRNIPAQRFEPTIAINRFSQLWITVLSQRKYIVPADNGCDVCSWQNDLYNTWNSWISY